MTILGVISGIAFAGTSKALVIETGLPWWAILLIALIPPVLGGLIDLAKNLLIKYGVFTKQEADEIADEIKDEIKDNANDLLDDGQLNNSNKNEDEEKEENNNDK